MTGNRWMEDQPGAWTRVHRRTTFGFTAVRTIVAAIRPPQSGACALKMCRHTEQAVHYDRVSLYLSVTFPLY